jgi:hypothetical protein
MPHCSEGAGFRVIARAKLTVFTLVFAALLAALLPLDAAYVKAGDPSAHSTPPPLPTLSPEAVPPRAARVTYAPSSADLVVVISLDGLRPDAITPALSGLHRLYLEGATPHFARTIDKSATLPSHASMVSGVDPEAHGLNFNAYRPSNGNIESPTIFSLVRNAGLPTAMFVGKSKLKHLLGRPGDAEFKMAGMFCEKLLRQALPHLQQAERGLLFLHFADPDSAGHRSGWMTETYLDAVRNVDRCLSKVIDTIEDGGRADRTLLIVTADHGGHNRSHGTRLDVDARIPWFARGAGTQRGRIGRNVHTTDTAATVLAALGVPVPAEMHGQPVLEALGRIGPDGMPLVGTPVQR